MSKFQIDFFELAILAQACIPPCPIARNMFFEKLSETYYTQMTAEERKRFFEIVSRYLNLEEEDNRHFYARYNPQNQYIVDCNFQGKRHNIKAYLYNGTYHVNRHQDIIPDYVISAVRLFAE